MDITFYSMNRLSTLDVKWVDLHNANNHFFNASHSNPFYEIVTVTQGPVFMRVQGEQLSLQTGEMLLLSPWEEHTGWKLIEESAGFFWIQFAVHPNFESVVTLQQFVSQMNLIHANPTDLRTDDVQCVDKILLPRRGILKHRYLVLSIFEKIRHEMSHPIGHYRLRMSLLLGQMLEMIASDCLENLDMQRTLPRSYMTYRRIVNFLDENYTRNLYPQEIENRLAHKYSYLCAVFKKYSGITIYAYIRRLRIQLASHFLSTTSASVRDIANRVGYDDPMYFSRCFRKVQLVSPSDYRTLRHNS